MGDYGNDTTPLDHYDSECHDGDNGINKKLKSMNDEDLIFMINLSEQTNRPRDMMMFLGEYIKETISICDKIENNI